MLGCSSIAGLRDLRGRPLRNAKPTAFACLTNANRFNGLSAADSARGAVATITPSNAAAVWTADVLNTAQETRAGADGTEARGHNVTKGGLLNSSP